MTKADECCDLLILDEAHRLKNNATATSMALSSLPCRRRVLLSGTPLQNDLEEFFAIVNFTNPDILGTQARFRKYYQSPILHGREPDCTDGEEELGKKRSEEMSEIVNHFILRRSNELNRKHLPEKIVNVVCIKLTELQKQVYNHLLTEKEISWQRDGTQSKSLLSINALKKLCNHPKLVYDDIRAAETNGKLEQAAHGFQNCRHLFPADFSARQRGRANQARVELAGKMDVLAQVDRMSIENLSCACIHIASFVALGVDAVETAPRKEGANSHCLKLHSGDHLFCLVEVAAATDV